MKAIINFVKGFQISRKNFRMVLFLLVVNLLFSLILAIPMVTSLGESIGQSEVGDRMQKGFDYIWWEEFRDQSNGIETSFSPSIMGKGAVLDNFVHLIHFGETPLPRVILVFAALYVLLHTFLSGGIISVLSKDIPVFSIRGFFSGAGKFASRFLLIMIISWVFFFLVIAFKDFLSSMVTSVSSTARSEIFPFYLSLLSSIFVYAVFLFFQMIFDYARIKTVIEDSRSVLQTTKDAFIFVFKNFGSTMGLFYLLLLANLILTVVFVFLREIIPQTTAVSIFVVFLVQQIFICSFIWVRCWLYSSQLELYKYLK
ncbi:MAG: hypothetical protein MUP98_11905 [Candidatus Aminicenantes bacterium]|nr:hypothetical protein [Candidatus Aminicenantes bacterium]